MRFVLAVGVSSMICPAAELWAHLHNVERTAEAFRTTAGDSRLVVGTLDPPLSDANPYLLLEISTPREADISVFWIKTTPGDLQATNLPLHVPSKGEFVTCVVDLGVCGKLDPAADQIWIHPGNGTGFTFNIRRIALLKREQVPPEFLPQLVDFRCITSKRHYKSGERIEYRASWQSRNYPNRKSSKILNIEIRNEAGEAVIADTKQWALLPLNHTKEVFGAFQPGQPLPPGKYKLNATSTDQADGLTLKATHDFGIADSGSPPLCETPFKFLKDFSLIRGHDGLWHLFSITGDLYGGHDWYADGQERTFSHGTSPDLRDWKWHTPVLSISDDRYPDGNGMYKDRNVWAPHVIRHDQTYYMFYTSVNGYGTQSISLATSKDLFTWTDHAENPVFTPEGNKDFAWSRKGGACRDPMVLVDGEKFYLYATADASEGENRGVIVVAESDDLTHWKNPRIAVRGAIASESPQVWKNGDTYYMLTSSLGSATYTSQHPTEGWKPAAFPRPLPQSIEKLVPVGGGYAEEIVKLDNGTQLIASLTYQHWGNTIYFFEMKTDEEGAPAGYVPMAK